MQRKQNATRWMLSAALLGAGLSTVVAPSSVEAKPAKAAGAMGKKGGHKGGPGIKQVEKAWGKPLTATQKTAVRSAVAARAKAMKPVQDKFKASVAKALGISVAQWEAKVKAQQKGKK